MKINDKVIVDFLEFKLKEFGDNYIKVKKTTPLFNGIKEETLTRRKNKNGETEVDWYILYNTSEGKISDCRLVKILEDGQTFCKIEKGFNDNNEWKRIEELNEWENIDIQPLLKANEDLKKLQEELKKDEAEKAKENKTEIEYEDERKENNNSHTEEITINGENYKITIYEKDELLLLVKINNDNSKYEDVILVINDEEENRVMRYYSSSKDSMQGEFSNVAIKRPKDKENSFEFRYANEDEVHDWKNEDSLYEAYDFTQKYVKSLLQAEKLFDEMNKERKSKEMKEENYEITKEDLEEVAKEQRTEKTNEISRKIKEDIKTEEKEIEEQGDNEK